MASVIYITRPNRRLDMDRENLQQGEELDLDRE